MNLFEQIAAHEDPYEHFYECISGNHGKMAEQACSDIYNDVSIDQSLHPDDDFEKIIEIAVEQIIDDFGA